MPEILVNAYRITGAGVPTAQASLQNACDQGSNVEAGGKRYGIRHVLMSEGFLLGEFGKLQTSDLPNVGGHDGSEEPLQLPDGKGLLYKSWFLYHFEHRALLWIGTRHACGPGWLLELLKRRQACRLSMSIMVPPAVYQRFRKNRAQVYALDYGIAPSKTVQTDSLVTKRLVRSAGDFDAEKMSLRMSVRRDSDSWLDSLKVSNLVKRAKDDPGTRKLKVSAIDVDSGEVVHVDLIRERTKTVHTSDWEIQQLPRQAAYEILKDSAAEIWAED